MHDPTSENAEENVTELLASLDRINALRADLIAVFGESTKRHSVSRSEAIDAVASIHNALQRRANESGKP